jgi:hypothetical protein
MRWIKIIGCWLACAASVVSAEDAAQLGTTDKLPEGLNEKIAALLDPAGHVVSMKDEAVCTVWLAKSLPVKEKFKPSLTTKYPLNPGQLVGALEVASKDFTDFRGQPVKPGVYTLRYGKQPTDGNHVGTSETSDFLLAIPAGSDTDPADVKVPTLMKRSAKATGSNHPAIFSLLPPNETPSEPALAHDQGKELWILQFQAAGKQGGEAAKVPFHLVVVGKSEG